MKPVLILLTTFCFTGVARASCPDQRYSSVSAVAAAAGSTYYLRSAREDREFIGGMLESDGRFSFTVSEGKIGEDEITTTITIPRGSHLSGLWHTHGSPHYSRKYFSELDTQLVKTLGVPLYLTDPAGHLRVYTPEARTLTRIQARKLGLGNYSGYARGSRVKDSIRC